MKNNHVLFSIMDISIKGLFFILFFFSPLLANAQVNLSGKVTDTKGENLIGVNVTIKKTGQGTVTDANGEFKLTVNDPEAVVEFSYVGYKTQDVPLNGRNYINVTLEEDDELLEEVVVVGYGTQKKINLTGSVQNVSSEDLVKRNVSNTSIALQGLIPGWNY